MPYSLMAVISNIGLFNGLPVINTDNQVILYLSNCDVNAGLFYGLPVLHATKMSKSHL